MENISSETTCSSCNAPISPTENFCPQCGTKLKEPPLSISVRKQAFIYLISFFLAPFGLGYAFKYLKQSDPKARKVGIIVVILTILAIALMIWVTKIFTSWEYQLIDTL
ncbi:MAG: zinc ribbon domain-containing protein [Patescibacteria group bacterium]